MKHNPGTDAQNVGKRNPLSQHFPFKFYYHADGYLSNLRCCFALQNNDTSNLKTAAESKVTVQEVPVGKSEKPTEISEPQSKDYSHYPELIGPPRAGDVIAYKVCTMDEQLLSCWSCGVWMTGGLPGSTNSVLSAFPHVTNCRKVFAYLYLCVCVCVCVCSCSRDGPST